MPKKKTSAVKLIPGGIIGQSDGSDDWINVGTAYVAFCVHVDRCIDHITFQDRDAYYHHLECLKSVSGTLPRELLPWVAPIVEAARYRDADKLRSAFKEFMTAAKPTDFVRMSKSELATKFDKAFISLKRRAKSGSLRMIEVDGTHDVLIHRGDLPPDGK